jgi:hypothetical protein
LLGVGAGDRASKDSEVSVVASDEPVSSGAGGMEEQHEETGGRGLKSWFKKKFKAREGYDGGEFGFQKMDA